MGVPGVFWSADLLASGGTYTSSDSVILFQYLKVFKGI
jgi:hypothetical protein